MDNRLMSSMSSLGDWFREQTWFQQVRGKWDEIDPQNRLYIQLGGATAVFGTLLLLLVSALVSMGVLKREVSEKRELLSILQSATDELRRLRDSRGAGVDTASAGAWTPYLQSIASKAGVDSANLTLGSEKQGQQTDLASEALFDLTLKKVSIRQVVRLAHTLETGTRPVKIRQMQIDTKADPEGYMDATISISAFSWTSPGNTQ